jgi:hypothetical protein
VARSHPQHGLHVASDAGVSPIRRSGGAAPWQAAQSPHAMAATCARFIASRAKTRRRHIPIPREIHQRSTKVDSFSGSQTNKGPTVGFIVAATLASERDRVAALSQRSRELGSIEGGNIAVDSLMTAPRSHANGRFLLVSLW